MHYVYGREYQYLVNYWVQKKGKLWVTERVSFQVK